MRFLLALTVVALGGCATPAPQKYVVDTYCSTSQQQLGTWSINDTPQTIQGAVARERAIDRRCRKS